MNIIAVQKSVRQTPRKVQLVVSALKDLSLEQAILQLGHIQRRSTIPVLKVVRQAIANAQHNHGLTIDQLKLQSIEITSGAQYKRFRAVSRGRAHNIVKKTSHIKVTLSVIDDSTVKSAKPSKAQAKVNSAQIKQVDSQDKQSEKQPAMNVAGKAPVATHTKVVPSAPIVPVRQSHQRKGSK